MWRCIEHRGLTDLSCRYCVAEAVAHGRGPTAFALAYDSPEERDDVGLTAEEARERGKAALGRGIPCVDVYVNVQRWGLQGRDGDGYTDDVRAAAAGG